MKLRPATLLAAFLTLSMSPAFAADPSTAAASETVDAPSTDEFLARLVSTSAFEIDSSKLAISKSKSETVRGFATVMVMDYSDIATRLRIVLSDSRVKEPSSKLDAEHQAVYDALKKKTAVAFEQAYIDAQMKGHVEMVTLAEAYARDGNNPRIKAFATDLLPMLRIHLDHVKKLQAGIGKG